VALVTRGGMGEHWLSSSTFARKPALRNRNRKINAGAGPYRKAGLRPRSRPRSESLASGSGGFSFKRAMKEHEDTFEKKQSLIKTLGLADRRSLRRREMWQPIQIAAVNQVGECHS